MGCQQLVVNLYDCGAQKLVPRLNKFLDNNGNYVKNKDIPLGNSYWSFHDLQVF